MGPFTGPADVGTTDADAGREALGAPALVAAEHWPSSTLWIEQSTACATSVVHPAAVTAAMINPTTTSRPTHSTLLWPRSEHIRHRGSSELGATAGI